MSTVSASPSTNYPRSQMEQAESAGNNQEWARIGAGCTLLAGALLLLAGKRRAGLVVTAAGAALTVLDQKETVEEWWNQLPGYLETAQHMLDEAQQTIDDVVAKRDRLKSLLGGR